MKYFKKSKEKQKQKEEMLKNQHEVRLLTTREVAEIFKVSKTQVQHWEKEGILKPIDWPDTVNGHERKKHFIRYNYMEIYRLING